MRFWIPAIAVMLLLASGAVGYSLWSNYKPPPSIQGAYLQPARRLASFTLIDHRQTIFERKDLKGRWHLVTYGYTNCPDICPLTLATLSRWVRRLEAEQVFPDVRVLFYSVDSKRDTPEVLQAYVPYFHPDFVGLTRSAPRRYQNFEQGLGIASERSGEASQWVNHGVMILLINPRAELQAVLKPERNEHGLFHFREETLMRDYQAVRRFYAHHDSRSASAAGY